MSINRYSLAWLATSTADRNRLIGWAQQGERYVNGSVDASHGVHLQPSVLSFTAEQDSSDVGDWTDDFERLGPTVQAPTLPVLLGLTSAPDSVAMTWDALQRDAQRREVPSFVLSLLTDWTAAGDAINPQSTTAERNRDLLMRQWFEGRVSRFPIRAQPPAPVPPVRPPGTSATPSGFIIAGLVLAVAAASKYGRHKTIARYGWTRFQRRY